MKLGVYFQLLWVPVITERVPFLLLKTVEVITACGTHQMEGFNSGDAPFSCTLALNAKSMKSRSDWGRLPSGLESWTEIASLAASAVGIFFVPGIFYLVEKLSGAGQEHIAAPLPKTPSPEPGD